MKVAISSAAFEALFARGDLTQLEWLELCGTELDVNGVVFDARHFPRTDDQYLAQLAKLAMDHGLHAAAVRLDAGVGADDESIEQRLREWIAVAHGVRAAMLVVSSTPAGDSPILPWQRALRAMKLAARHAKEHNVLLGIVNLPGTLCAGAADFKRFAKDVDSAWLRYALIPASLTDEDIALCADRVALAISEPQDVPRALEKLAGFRGSLVIETHGRDAQSVAATLSDLNHANRLHVRF